LSVNTAALLANTECRVRTHGCRTYRRLGNKTKGKEQMQVQDYMSTNLITVEAKDSVLKVLQLFKEKKIRRVPVVQGKELKGLVTDRDIKILTASKGMPVDSYELNYFFSSLTVKDVMTPDPITVRPEDDLELAIKILLQHRISGLPVVQEKDLVGIISETDLLRALLELSGGFEAGYKLNLEVASLDELIKVFEVLKQENCAMQHVQSTLVWPGLYGKSQKKMLLKLKVDQQTIKTIQTKLKKDAK